MTTYIFDFDGVIADSLTALFEIYREILRDYGGTPSKAEFHTLNGPKLERIAETLIEQHGLRVPKNRFISDYRGRLAQLYNRVVPCEAAEDIIRLLDRLGIRLGLASSAPLDQIRTWLQRYNLLHCFDAICSGDEVTKAKPAPDLYELAKHKLGPDTDIWVVEDAPHGIAAAKAAGLKVCGLGQGCSSCQSDLHIATLRELPVLQALEAPSTQVLALAEAVKLHEVDEPLRLQDEQLRMQVAYLWDKAAIVNKKLFDAPVWAFSGHHWADNLLVLDVFATSYRFIHAMLSGQLEVLNQHPIVALAVSGLITNDRNQILVGQRAAWVTEYRSCWETIPAGGWTPRHSNYGDALLEEWAEETGLSANHLTSVRSIGLVWDKHHQVVDLACHANLSQPHPQFSRTQHEEYEATGQEPFTWMPPSQLIDKTSSVVPVSLTLAKLFTHYPQLFMQS